MLQTQVATLPKPPKRVMKAFRRWIKTVKPLVGDSKAVLEESDDFLSLETAKKDRLTAVLENYGGYVLKVGPEERELWVKLTHQKGKDPTSDVDAVGVETYSGNTIEAVVTALSIIIPAALLVGGMATLLADGRAGPRLGFVAMYTFLFAASVALLTSAGRAEVFAASAAYV
jgi:hypothetical protein